MKKYITDTAMKKIERLSEGDKSVPMYQKILKLSEEAGEVAEAYGDMSFDNLDSIHEVIEESCDTINVGLDILNVYNIQYNIDLMFEAEDYHERGLDENINHIASEVGKVCQAFLRVDCAKNVSKSADDGIENLTFQVFSVINAAHSIISTIYHEYEVDENYAEEIFAKKLNKWESKQLNY